MKRVTFVVAALIAGLSGCMTPAHLVEKGKDQGVVAIPEWTNEWPTYYKDAAIDLIKQHVGSSYEIVKTYSVVVGNSPNSPQMSPEPANPGSSSTKTEYRIVYVKKPLQPGIPFGGPIPAPYSTRPLPPAGAPAGSGLGAGMVPAGGYVPGSVTGGGSMSSGMPMNPNIPSVAPVGNPYQYPAPPGVNPYTGR